MSKKGLADPKRGKVFIHFGELELAWDELKELIDYLEDNPANAPIYIDIGDQRFEAV